MNPKFRKVIVWALLLSLVLSLVPAVVLSASAEGTYKAAVTYKIADGDSSEPVSFDIVSGTEVNAVEKFGSSSQMPNTVYFDCVENAKTASDQAVPVENGKFTMPEENISLTMLYRSKITVTVKDADGNTLGTCSGKPGETKTVNVKPADGKYISDVTGADKNAIDSNGNLSVTIGSSNSEVVVTYAQCPTVTVQDADGKAMASAGGICEPGKTFTVVPETRTGYYVSDISGVEGLSRTNGTFTMGNADVTVTVTYAKIPTVTVESKTINGTQGVALGNSDLTLKVVDGTFHADKTAISVANMGGVTVSGVSASDSDTKLTVTLAGAPEKASQDTVELSVKGTLVGLPEDVTVPVTSNAKWNIAAVYTLEAKDNAVIVTDGGNKTTVGNIVSGTAYTVLLPKSAVQEGDYLAYFKVEANGRTEKAEPVETAEGYTCSVTVKADTKVTPAYLVATESLKLMRGGKALENVTITSGATYDGITVEASPKDADPQITVEYDKSIVTVTEKNGEYSIKALKGGSTDVVFTATDKTGENAKAVPVKATLHVEVQAQYVNIHVAAPKITDKESDAKNYVSYTAKLYKVANDVYTDVSDTDLESGSGMTLQLILEARTEFFNFFRLEHYNQSTSIRLEDENGDNVGITVTKVGLAEDKSDSSKSYAAWTITVPAGTVGDCTLHFCVRPTTHAIAAGTSSQYLLKVKGLDDDSSDAYQKLRDKLNGPDEDYVRFDFTAKTVTENSKIKTLRENNKYTLYRSLSLGMTAVSYDVSEEGTVLKGKESSLDTGSVLLDMNFGFNDRNVYTKAYYVKNGSAKTYESAERDGAILKVTGVRLALESDGSRSPIVLAWKTKTLNGNPATGDRTNPAVLYTISILCGAGIGAAWYFYKKNNRK